MFHKVRSEKRTVVLAAALGCGLLFSAEGQTNAPPSSQPATPSRSTATGTPYRFQPGRAFQRANAYYSMVWGVDALNVKWSESGEIVRFSYQVVDADKAKTLNDKKFEPSLIDPQAGVKLVVPSLEKVGQLRQSSTPIAGKSYWMGFSNKGRVVKRGDRVTVQIGQFRADGLVVE